MTPDEINTRLAKWAGGVSAGESRSLISGNWEQLWAFPDCDAPCWTPNYTTDLNAIATIEAKLTDEQWKIYLSWLWVDLCPVDFYEAIGGDYDETRILMGATALQKATALVRALGLEGGAC